MIAAENSLSSYRIISCFRIRSALLLLIYTAIALSSCSTIPPNYSFDRIPERFEEMRRTPEIREVNNCASDLAVEQTVSATTLLGQTVMLDEQQVNSIGAQAGLYGGVSAGAGGIGVSAGGELLIEIKKEIARRFGAGLENNKSKTESLLVRVNPRRKAIVTLEWIETWEYGYFTIYKDRTAIGTVSYRLLKDIKLNSRIRSVRCDWIGELEEKAWQAWGVARESWPLQHLEITIPVLMVLILTGAWIRRRVYRKRLNDQSYY